MLRVAFLGTLTNVGWAIALSPHRLVAVASPSGGGRLRAALRAAARRWLPAAAPDDLRSLVRATGAPVLPPGLGGERGFLDALRRAHPEVVVVAGWPARLGPELLSLPPLGCINVHPSLLPRHRGPNPCPRVILAGETESGVTVHRMVERFDAGPILAQRRVPVLPLDTAGTLTARSLAAALELVPEVLSALEVGTAAGTPQDERAATHDPGLRPADVRLDFALPARVLHDRIRACVPPHARARLDGRRVRILGSQPLSAPAGAEAPGRVLGAAGPLARVATGDGTLLVTLEARAARWLAPGRRLRAD